ncbi:MAG: LruC domain-containing protein [Pseudomonadota bacterium]
MRALLFFLLLFSRPVHAASYGAPAGGAVQDNAIVCVSIGAYAELTGLDDFRLTASGTSGAAGTEYHGSDQFHLNSNVPVRIVIEALPLSNGEFSIDTTAMIDDFVQFFDTEGDAGHDGEHELSVRGRLGAISSQLAGNYQTTITLTVLPLAGGGAGCGEVSLTFPGEANANYAVLAFEDLYPRAGDADYNDFVVRYSVTENYNATGGLETIEMNFTPIARGAGYNHALMLDLDGVIKNTRNAFTEVDAPFVGDAQIKLTYTNLTNNTEKVKYFGVDDDIPIFHNTRSTLEGYANVYDNGEFVAPKTETKIEITLANPELNALSEAHEITMDKYRVFLDVMNTNNDIDLANVNPNDGMIDANGYPFGIVVPDDWAWMLESHSIDEAYPYFDEYRQFLAGEVEELSPEAENWFSAVDTNSNATVDLQALEIFLAELE